MGENVDDCIQLVRGNEGQVRSLTAIEERHIPESRLTEALSIPGSNWWRLKLYVPRSLYWRALKYLRAISVNRRWYHVVTYQRPSAGNSEANGEDDNTPQEVRVQFANRKTQQKECDGNFRDRYPKYQSDHVEKTCSEDLSISILVGLHDSNIFADSKKHLTYIGCKANSSANLVTHS